MKIVVAPDSFKGTLSAREAAAAMASGVRRRYPNAEILQMPLADGGEGTAEALVTTTGGRLETRRVTGPLGSSVEASFGLLGPNERTAVVEMAQAAGLGLVPPHQRDPRVTTTLGVGELLHAAAETGAREILVGLGGSATNDGGAGAMQALGARFLDSSGHELPPGGAALARLARIDLSSFHFPSHIKIIAASDVRNPMVGPDGASAIYGPQKGADAAAVVELDAALAHYAKVVSRHLGRDVAHLPGAGAAGGLGAALAAFLNASFKNGIEVVLDAADFDTHARDADWVLTGEGKIDEQTLSGKTVAGVLARCRRLQIRVIAFGGTVEAGAAETLRAQGLWDVVPLVSGTVMQEQAMREPVRVLEEAVARTVLQR